MEEVTDKTTDLIEGSRTEIAAHMIISGASASQVGKKLGLSRHATNKLLNSEEFHKLLSELKEQACKTLLNAWSAGMTELFPLAKRALIGALKEHKMDAVRVYLESIGMNQQTAAAPAQNLQIILPNYEDAKTITVEGNTNDEHQETE